MITTPTVFVLGAGASIPYDFPSGAELRLEICELLEGQQFLLKELCKYTNFSSKDVIEFGRSFKESNLNSIDSFLAKRTQFVDIGKFAIAYLLCTRELSARLNHLRIEDNWYVALWNALQTEISNIDDLANNQIKIITFNYDRSLESFLTTSIMSTFGVNEKKAIEVVGNLSISHVYGSLGEFGNENGKRIYDPAIDEETLKLAANSIRIIPEFRDDDVVFEKAREWFDWAKKICFLGFSFDELNVKRLNLKSVIDGKDRKSQNFPPMVIASTFEMTQSEINFAQTSLGVETPKWYPFAGKSLQTIRENIHILK